jgi:archaeal flagellin FlaB
MYQRFNSQVRRFFKEEKGITGLETAIILIAFVTVAAVLAYTVLSAGIFSAERGKEAVYSGLESAQSTMTLRGSVVGTADSDTNPTKLVSVTFNLGLAITGTGVDLSQLVINYWDSSTPVTTLTLDDTNPTVTAGSWSFEVYNSTGTFLIGTAEASVTVVLPDTADIEAYSTFTIQINPPTGASITIQRTAGPIAPIMSLN